jgi:hypothetical protein
MDGARGCAAGEQRARRLSGPALQVAQVPAEAARPAAALARQLGPGPFALVCLFASPKADFDALSREARATFPGTDVLACTTAGELGRQGYERGQIMAVGFPAALFTVITCAIDGLDSLDEPALIDALIRHRMQLNRDGAGMAHEFAFLMVDGLSLCEERLASALASGLGPMPLFGGSSGDGTAFRATWLSRNGVVRRNAALLAMLRSHCPVRVFSLDNLVPTETRMVVTRASPERRVVHEINAEPAAQEYARLLGKDPNQLGSFTFAAHPVVVRVGDRHHVRAIQQVSENSDLVFFSAINEGMVLTLASHQDIARHLDAGLGALAREAAPEHILGCDCLLRRIDAEQMQKGHEISGILQRHRVIGFSTYGEQLGGLHVNQTLTGVAIYPPVEDGCP